MLFDNMDLWFLNMHTSSAVKSLGDSVPWNVQMSNS